MKKHLNLFFCGALIAVHCAAQPRRPQFPVEGIMRNHAMLPNIQPYTGVAVGAKAAASPGNKTDGSGYFMIGAKPNSFFYYVNRTDKAYANWGAIRDKYTQAGYEFGALGWPSDDEYLLPDATGFFQRFDHGYIYWHPNFGAHIVKGMIFGDWAKNNWEKGVFGYPVSDEINYPVSQADYNDRRKPEIYISYQNFQNGTIYLVYDKITKQDKITAHIKDPNFNPSRPH
jgi:LGFP repeat-containing protein